MEFQLLEVVSRASEEVFGGRRTSGARFDLTDGASVFAEGQHVTAIIGKNGSGKSHMLSSVVETFLLLEEMAKGKNPAKVELPLARLVYRASGRTCVVEHSPFGPTLLVEGHRVPPELLPLPSRIVALTISPFDKFPVPKSLPLSMEVASNSNSSLYRYLGLRDRTGRAAIENLLFRSLNSIFEDRGVKDNFRRANLARVFEFLKLSPTLSISYRLRISRTVTEAVFQGRNILDPEVILDKRIAERARDVVELEGITPEHMAFLLTKVIDRQRGGKIRYETHFRRAGSQDEEFREVQPLRRAGFLQLNAVDILRNGLPTNLKDASSGEVSIVTALLSLASVIKHGSLVLIDEPELSLHPEWQVRYVDLLLQTFSNYLGCHFVIATHSPLVVSELPSNANIVSLDDRALPPLSALSGQPADLLLAEAFGLPNSNNYYVREQLLLAAQLIAEGEVESAQFNEAFGRIRRLASEMDTDDPALVIVEGLVKAAETRSGSKTTWK
ncbi:AAA family ATPase [Paenarthrobacter sp. NPDC058040]|uniref:AAA family ATPase n=1 Tax=unclassified Paenarthrobacter TaxID=2634190 RepID=UPI0036DCFF59